MYQACTRKMHSLLLEVRICASYQVESARLRADERCGVITFAAADGARAAMAAMNGTQLCGEALTVTATDPQAGARTSKRPRVAA